jgi:hypothetical protein
VKTSSARSKRSSSEIKVGDTVVVRKGTYNRSGDNLGYARCVVKSISGKRAGVEFLGQSKVEPRLCILLLENLVREDLAGMFFEYQCVKRNCKRSYWVKAIGPVDGLWLFGSSADFCDHCGKSGPKRTGMAREDGVIEEYTPTPDIIIGDVLEEVTTRKTYDVKAHVACGSVTYYLWEKGAAVGSPINPFAGLTKLEGEGGRMRVTVTVELLKKGKPAKPWHKKGCKACETVRRMSPKEVKSA